MDNWLNVRVKGTASWPSKETTVIFGGHELLVKPATRDDDQSIHVNLQRISAVEALTLINRFLSVLSWCDDQPMENGYGLSGTSVPVAVGRESRSVGSSIAFPFYRNVESEPNTRLALALCREGRTVNSIPFSFLSYFKILNIFWNGRNEIIEGLRATVPKITDVDAIARAKELQASIPDVPRYLYEPGRCAIAHAFADPLVDPDDVANLRRLSQDLEIVKAVAEHLIEEKMGVSRSIIG